MTVADWIKEKAKKKKGKIMSDSKNEKSIDKVLSSIKEISKRVYSGEEDRIRIFELGEKHGIHITPVHFYQPIPDTRNIPVDLFNKPKSFAGINFREKEQIELLKQFSKYADELKDIPLKPTSDKKQYYYENDFYGQMDAIIYYSMIREFVPKKIIEVGSGFSTMIASQAATKNGNTIITSIEPFPNKILKSGLPNVKELIEDKVQNVSIDQFKKLEKNDILFIDSSHISTIGSDVNYLFLEVLPQLNSGVLIHIHDWLFPYEYFHQWVIERKLFWNEMYLVHAFLIGNYDYEILLSNYYLIRNHFDVFRGSFPFVQETIGGSGSLWLRKK